MMISSCTLALLAGLVAGETCEPTGQPSAGPPTGIALGSSESLAFVDDGTGPVLVVAGNFSSIEGVAVQNVARFDGSSWSPLGGLPSTVLSLAVHDSGSGDELFASGNFQGTFARWTGSAWEAFTSPGSSSALLTYDDGSGPAFYAGGGFGVSRWNGASWSPISNDPLGAVHSLEAHAGRLYFGGSFLSTAQTDDGHLSSWGKPCDGPLPYCTATPSSSGCLASISTSDLLAQPVSGAANYTVTASAVEASKPGLLFVGITGPAQTPFSGGTLCASPPLERGPLLHSGGLSPGTCSGSFTQLVNDGNLVPLGLDPGPGASSWNQFWFRDPSNPNGSGTALSNAIRLDF